MRFVKIASHVWAVYAVDPETNNYCYLGSFTDTDLQDQLNGWSDEGRIKE